MRRKYGQLGSNWREDLRKGFSECFRVLQPLGTLVFKWSDGQIRVREVLALTPEKPLVGNRRGRGTVWIIFQKMEKSPVGAGGPDERNEE